MVYSEDVVNHRFTNCQQGTDNNFELQLKDRVKSARSFNKCEIKGA